MLDSFQCKETLRVGDQKYHYFNLQTAAKNGLQGISRLPFSLKVLLENSLRHEDGRQTTKASLEAFSRWLLTRQSSQEIFYYPSRVLMQDFTGVPAIVDLAAMRDAMVEEGGDPKQINPLCPVDLIIDHSVIAEEHGTASASQANVTHEMRRNIERYKAIKWAQEKLDNFRVVPPGTGICHQVNLEYLGTCVSQKKQDEETLVFFDSLVGTDSHTTMINGLGVLGWGVGGIEAEAAMLGQGLSMRLPEVIGVRLMGSLSPGVTATDLVLTMTERLRQKGVVGKFVEFCGPGLANLSLADRATISNMSPEFGATCAIFPMDQSTLDYLALTGRSSEQIALVEMYCKAQGVWVDNKTEDPVFSDVITVSLPEVCPSVAGPKRPQDRLLLSELKEQTIQGLSQQKSAPVESSDFQSLHHGAVVIAAITSCTNTSNPSVMMAAGLLAKKAVEKGLTVKPWVKTSFAPGSKVVTAYLEKAGLITYLEQLGFYLVGYGCTTCIGNSGPLIPAVQQEVSEKDLLVASVLSGNRNFEGRIHPFVKSNWLASPPLVVAYALAGTTCIDLDQDVLGMDQQGHPILLTDVWPSNHEIQEAVSLVTKSMFMSQYQTVFSGDEVWQGISGSEKETYPWESSSTYIQKPAFFVKKSLNNTVEAPTVLKGARVLALLGDSVTTDHISPAGNIKADSPAGTYLTQHGVEVEEFNSYGSRRGNHEVMIRGTFANIRLQNEMVPGQTGGYTKHFPSGQQMTIYDAAMRYQQEAVSLVVVAGKEYGTGSSRDWAAKGTLLLGVKAVIAESFERIHRSNLIGMGVLPLQFEDGLDRLQLNLTGEELIDIDLPIASDLKPGMHVQATITFSKGSSKTIHLLCRLDTPKEKEFYEAGGILQYVLRQIKKT